VLLLVLASSLFGCSVDPCNALCNTVVQRIDACRGEWGATWEDFDAASRADLRQTCQDEWDVTRGEIPTRQIPEADDACSAATDDLSAMNCDELRALYLP
jgi:hypothetical protein